MSSRRPPDTPGWRFPVAYTLKWVATYLVLSAVLAFAFRTWFGDQWMALAALVAGILIYGARMFYERDSGGPRRRE